MTGVLAAGAAPSEFDKVLDRIELVKDAKKYREKIAALDTRVVEAQEAESAAKKAEAAAQARIAEAVDRETKLAARETALAAGQATLKADREDHRKAVADLKPQLDAIEAGKRLNVSRGEELDRRASEVAADEDRAAKSKAEAVARLESVNAVAVEIAVLAKGL